MWSDLAEIDKRDFWSDLVACLVAAILGLFIWVVFSVLPPPAPPEKDWCRGEFGHTRPMSFCDD